MLFAEELKRVMRAAFWATNYLTVVIAGPVSFNEGKQVYDVAHV